MASVLENLVKKYDVHPEAVSFLQTKAEQNVQPYYEQELQRARHDRLKSAEYFAGTAELDGTEREFFVPSPYSSDGIPVTVYRPTSCDKQTAPPIIVYFHGGGNVVGCRRSHEAICKTLARDASCLVMNVGYRKAPEHRFPANHEDAKCVIRWLNMNKSLVGAVNASAVGVAGDSAGGRLAAVVSHELPNIIQFAILVYPGVTYSSTEMYPSYQEFAAGPVLSAAVRQWFKEQYLSPADCDKPRASPILYKDFSGLPPTLLIVAELDPLRDGCYAYYEKLQAAGVQSDILTVKGVVHTFWSLPGHFKETGQQARRKAVEFIKLHSSPTDFKDCTIQSYSERRRTAENKTNEDTPALNGPV